MKQTIGRIIMRFFCSFFLFASSLSLFAQKDGIVDIKGNVVLMNYVDNKIEELKNAEEVYFGVGTIETLKAAKDEIDKIRMGADKEWEKEDKIKAIRKKYKLTSSTRGSSKSFKKQLPADWGLLFVTVIDGRTSEVITIKPGQTDYRVEIRVERLGEAVGTGKAQLVSIKGGGGADADDGNERIFIHLHLIPGSARSDARLIIQPYLVDCVSEDTLMNCEPIVFEGKDYHRVQNKRMAFNYMKHDILADYYHTSDSLVDGKKFDFDTMLVVPKPDKKRAYKGPYTYSFEDYSHVYEIDSYAGTCLKPRPFKLLDFTPALANLKLTSEFYEDAETKFDKKKQDLALRFVTGSDVLQDDSVNIVERNKLIKELQSYGESLVNPVIVGGASPDGSRATNENLAKKRAERAKAMFRPFLPSHVSLTTSTKVYSWGDVVNELTRKGNVEEAEAINSILATGLKDDIGLTRAIKAIPSYDEIILPVLDRFKVMQCTYQVMRDYVMTPEECVDEFHKNKKDYIAGNKHFSNGDYYNLFSNITDSTELNELTVMAYREVTAGEEYYNYSPMAPYVCNRMAILNLKRGVANSSILDPFIDYSKQRINQKKGVTETRIITVNRKEICINQAVTYYQLQQMDSARHLINLIKKDPVAAKDKNLVMLERFMHLKELHFKDNRTAAEQAEYEKSKETVLGLSNENKAILYTEIDAWDKRDEARTWVNLMDDNDPKKWYLKGILAADKILNKKSDQESESNEDDSDGEEGDSEEEQNADPSNDTDGDCFPCVAAEDEQMLMYERSEDYYKEYMVAKQEYMDSHDGKLPPVGECLRGTASGNALQSDSTANAAEEPEPELVDDNTIPDYLAYFHQAFKLEKSYKKFYSAEGHVPETLRKKYKYLKKDIPAYEARFKKLKEKDNEDRRKAKRKATKQASPSEDPWS